MTEREVRQVVKDTVRETLIEMGIAHDDPIQMQKDFQHLRDWRTGTDAVKKRGMLTIVGVLVTGLMAAIFMGIRSMYSG